MSNDLVMPNWTFQALWLKAYLLIANIYFQRPKAEGLSKIRVAKKFGYRVEVCLFRRRYVCM